MPNGEPSGPNSILTITRVKLGGLLVGLGLTGLLLLSGCQSDKPGGSSHAAVEIKGHTAEAIQATTVAVFAENGYTLRTNTPTSMWFDRPATTGEKVKYGDWMNEGMLMSVKVRLQSQPKDTYLLRADAYMIQEPTNPVFREESRLMLFNAKTYRKYLEEVSNRLDFPLPK